jgi:hypothetical protein
VGAVGGGPVHVPGVSVAIYELSLLPREELLDGAEGSGWEGEGETQFVGGAVVEAHRLENDGEDQHLQCARSLRTHLNDQNNTSICITLIIGGT